MRMHARVLTGRMPANITGRADRLKLREDCTSSCQCFFFLRGNQGKYSLFQLCASRTCILQFKDIGKNKDYI